MSFPLFTLAIRLETEQGIRIDRIKKREHEKFGSRIDIGGDMHKNHLDFLEWARVYDSGDISIRSKVKHDEWQKQLKCKLLCLNGADDLHYNFIKIMDSISFQKN